MHWNGLQDFLSMGGYGFYVWTSFGLTFICFTLELVLLRKRAKGLTSEGQA